jgi:hypothetical protein
MRLVLDAEHGAEKGPDRFARDARELIDKGGEVDGTHQASPALVLAARAASGNASEFFVPFLEKAVVEPARKAVLKFCHSGGKK